MVSACEEKDMKEFFMRRDGFKCFVSPGASHASISPATCRMLFFLLGVLKPVFLSYPPHQPQWFFSYGFSHPFSIPVKYDDGGDV